MLLREMYHTPRSCDAAQLPIDTYIVCRGCGEAGHVHTSCVSRRSFGGERQTSSCASGLGGKAGRRETSERTESILTGTSRRRCVIYDGDTVRQNNPTESRDDEKSNTTTYSCGALLWMLPILEHGLVL